MSDTVNILLNIYGVASVFTFLFAFVTTLIIFTEEIGFDPNTIMANPKAFVKCIFMWQVAIYVLLQDDVKPGGIVFLIVLSSLLLWPENLGVLCVLLLAKFIQFLVFVFMGVFGKGDEN